MSAENIVLPIFNVGRKYSPTFLNSSRKTVPYIMLAEGIV